MIKRLLLISFLSVLASVAALGQNLSVSKFYLAEADNTANLSGTIVYDQNGDKCALIRVQTTQTGFAWDFGQMQALKVIQKTGEIWVYVPYGVKKVTMRHPQLGTYVYTFPIPVEKARTYVMQLIGANGHFVYDPDSTQQWLVFEVTPDESLVELDGDLLEVKDGIAKKFVNFGTYSYKISCARYYSVEGTVEVNNPDESTRLSIALKPQFGYISIPASGVLSGAVVYVDDRQIGNIPIQSESIREGKHSLRILKPKYQTYTESFEVTSGCDLTFNPVLTPNFKTFKLEAVSGATVKANGEVVGTTPCTADLEYGAYSFEISKPSYTTQYKSMTITASTSENIKFPDLVPIYGGLNIDSDTGSVQVYIDGVSAGTTPLYKPKMLVGEHKVELKKDGYETKTLTVDIEEGQTKSIAEVLSVAKPSTSSTSYSSGTLYNSGKSYSSGSSYSTGGSYFTGNSSYSSSSYKKKKSLQTNDAKNLIGLSLMPIKTHFEYDDWAFLGLAVNYRYYFGNVIGGSMGMDFTYYTTTESDGSLDGFSWTIPLDFVVRFKYFQMNAGLYGGLNLASTLKYDGQQFDLLKLKMVNVGTVGMQLGGGFNLWCFYLGYNYVQSFVKYFKDGSTYNAHTVTLAIIF